MRTLAVAIVTAGVGLGVMGVAPAGAQTTDTTEFCDAVLEVESVIAQERFDELDPVLTKAETSAPAEIAASVQALVAQTRTAIETETDPSDDPGYRELENTLGEYVYTSCGWQAYEVTMSEYAFEGIPKTLTTGPVAFKLVNEGAEVHEIVPLRIKNKNDKLKALLRLPEKKVEKKIQVLDHELAAPGDTAYMFLDLTKAGNYGAVCFVPVGTLDLASLEGEHGGGDGPPHAFEGMYTTFKVTKG
jgi:hypothetical protein